jgi:hypothetical protein
MANIDDIKEDLQRALDLRAAGRLAAALDILLVVSERRPDVTGVHMILGSVHEELGDLRAAECSYRNASELSPKLELASLSLFHVLHSQRRLDEAFAEMKRFKDLCIPSPRYDQMMRDVTDPSEGDE